MAKLFAARGNPKRALECVDEALLSRGREAHLHLRRAEYLEQLDRPAAAASAMERAVELEKSSELAKSSPLGDPL
jgi:predicted RNA polymerase sigma factor